MLLHYSINGIPFSSFGLYVSDSEGLLDQPERKESIEMDYPDAHGIQIDLSRPRYKARQIRLSCFMVSKNPSEFMDRWLALLAQLQRPGTQRIALDGALDKQLVYEVFLAERIEPKKTWRETDFLAEFDLSLTEPRPVKWVLANTHQIVSLTASCRSPLTLSWGDGTQDVLKGDSVTLSHAYPDLAAYHLVVAGELEALQNPQTTGLATVWTRL